MNRTGRCIHKFAILAEAPRAQKAGPGVHFATSCGKLKNIDLFSQRHKIVELAFCLSVRTGNVLHTDLSQHYVDSADSKRFVQGQFVPFFLECEGHPLPARLESLSPRHSPTQRTSGQSAKMGSGTYLWLKPVSSDNLSLHHTANDRFIQNQCNAMQPTESKNLMLSEHTHRM